MPITRFGPIDDALAGEVAAPCRAAGQTGNRDTEAASLGGLTSFDGRHSDAAAPWTAEIAAHAPAADLGRRVEPCGAAHDESRGYRT